MTARLFIREVNAREFIQSGGDFVDALSATQEGEKICANGNGEAYEVWELHSAKRRVWRMEDATDA